MAMATSVPSSPTWFARLVINALATLGAGDGDLRIGSWSDSLLVQRDCSFQGVARSMPTSSVAHQAIKRIDNRRSKILENKGPRRRKAIRVRANKTDKTEI